MVVMVGELVGWSEVTYACRASISAAIMLHVVLALHICPTCSL